MRRAAVALVAVAVGSAVLSGCGGSSDADAGEVGSGPTLRLVIPDGNIRDVDSPCSGAAGYRFAHPQAPFVIQDDDGSEVASGVLPEGRAEAVTTLDVGERPQPTVCVMMIDVAGVESLEGLTLVVDDHLPVQITRNHNLDDIPEAVLP